MNSADRGAAARFDQAPCGYVEFDDDGVILAANETLARWLGKARAELLGCKFESILTVANRVFFQTHFFPLLRLQGNVEEIFLTLRRQDGTPLPVVSSAGRIEGPPAPRIQCVFLAVTQRRKYEDEILRAKQIAEDALKTNTQLQAARAEGEAHATELERRLREIESRNEELQHVSQILAHDLREPIRKIELFADLVRAGLKTARADEVAVALSKIETEASQMEQLIGTVRQYLDANPGPELELTDLKAVVERAATATSLKLGFTDWVMDCGELPSVQGHRELLQVLFGHLLENAIKFRHRDRRLRVSVQGRIIQENIYEATKGRYRYVDFAQIEVADNGRGFDPKYRDYIFRLLKKVDLDSPGLGVGLATCRKIAAAHYGTISADTHAAGSVFTLRLPVSPGSSGNALPRV